ncbi:MAG TPA: hypothetical protein VLJ58_20385 [Ramlibacter sp.]|nr:hypothetical protein [Ramlibacter sp.]
MNYRCPQCARMLSVRKLFFSDVSACRHCGQRVVLGDFVSFLVAAVAMLVTALSALYTLTYNLQDAIIAGGYSLSIGMGSGIAVLLLLGKATPFKRIGHGRPAPAMQAAPASAEPAAKAQQDGKRR